MSNGPTQPLKPVQMLSEVVKDLQQSTGGDLTEDESKTVDLVIRKLQLLIYTRRRAALSAHHGWAENVRRQIAAGASDDPGLDHDGIDALIRG